MSGTCPVCERFVEFIFLLCISDKHDLYACPNCGITKIDEEL